MGLFGKLGRALTQPGDSGLSFLDRAAIFATAAGGDTQGAIALRQMPAQRQRMKAQQDFGSTLMDLLQGSPGSVEQARIEAPGGADVSDAFGPQFDVTPGRAPLNINSPELGQLAVQGDQIGYNMNSLLDVLKAQQPKFGFTPSNEMFNEKTGRFTGISAPKTGEGQQVQRGPSGEVMSIDNAPGYVKSAAEAAGAIESAKEGAKAGYDMVEVKVGGSVVQLPRAVALPLILQAFGNNNPDGLPANFGRTPTPEEQALATGRATNQVKQEGMVGDATVQAGLDLPKVRDQAQSTLNILDKIRTHPSFADRTGNSTLLPALRPQDVDFDVMVKQVGGGAFLEAIQSLKGTGQITEIEGKKATDAIARMQNQRQSQAGFLTAMRDYEDIVRRGLSRAERRAGAPSRPAARPGGGDYSRQAIEAEMRRRGLIQ